MARQAGGGIPSDDRYGSSQPDPEWKLALVLAVGLHVAILVLALASPLLFKRPPLPEIQVVSLFNAVEPGPPGPAAKGRKGPPPPKAEALPKPEPPAEKIKTIESPPIKKEVEPIPAPPQPKVPAKPRAISERPLPVKTAKDLAKLKEIKHLLAEQEAQEAQKFADRQIKAALAQLKAAYKDQSLAASTSAAAAAPSTSGPATGSGAATGSPTAAGTGAGAGGGQGMIVEEALRRYLAAVHSRIQEHWTLPDLQTWDDSLEAVYVIRIRKDGTISSSEFEKSSKDPHFDQFVEKTIREASPLPPFPPELREEELEVGLRFRPGVIL
ncbi:MAG: TonB family protein [Desulfobacteraceae bacterium]|nr:TonB family protein [Desulfobacteraceae bacterium]